MSDTPRTNAILTAILETHGHVGFFNCPPTWVAFARELERELNAANDRIKRLDEAGDAIVGYNIGCGCGEDGPCRACRNAVEAWHKAKEAKP